MCRYMIPMLRFRYFQVLLLPGFYSIVFSWCFYFYLKKVKIILTLGRTRGWMPPFRGFSEFFPRGQNIDISTWCFQWLFVHPLRAFWVEFSDGQFIWLKCNLGKVKLHANAVSGLFLKRAWSVGWPQGPFAYLVTYVASHAGIFELIFAGLSESLRILRRSCSRPTFKAPVPKLIYWRWL